MGRDKRNLVLGHETLLARTVRILGDVADEVVVAGGVEEGGFPVATRWVRDAEPHAGPLAGLLAGLREIRHEHAIVVATDLPFLDPAVLRYLVSCGAGADAVIPRVGGHPQPTHAVYAATAAPVIERRLSQGLRSLRGLLDDLQVCWVDEAHLRAVDASLRSFVNVNTPEEWEAVSGEGYP